MEYLITALVVLFGAFVYQKKKSDIAEARNDNLDTKEKLNTIDKSIASNEGQIEAEEQKQTDLKKEVEDVQKSSNIIDNITNFLNKR